MLKKIILLSVLFTFLYFNTYSQFTYLEVKSFLNKSSIQLNESLTKKGFKLIKKKVDEDGMPTFMWQHSITKDFCGLYILAFSDSNKQAKLAKQFTIMPQQHSKYNALLGEIKKLKLKSVQVSNNDNKYIGTMFTDSAYSITFKIQEIKGSPYYMIECNLTTDFMLSLVFQKFFSPLWVAHVNSLKPID